MCVGGGGVESCPGSEKYLMNKCAPSVRWVAALHHGLVDELHGRRQKCALLTNATGLPVNVEKQLPTNDWRSAL